MTTRHVGRVPFSMSAQGSGPSTISVGTIDLANDFPVSFAANNSAILFKITHMVFECDSGGGGVTLYKELSYASVIRTAGGVAPGTLSPTPYAGGTTTYSTISTDGSDVITFQGVGQTGKIRRHFMVVSVQAVYDSDIV